MKHRIKIGKSDVGKMQHVAHMIGDVQAMKIEVTTSMIANWLGCTKPTALKVLNMMQEYRYIECYEKDHRPNRTAFAWKLTERAQERYTNKEFYEHHKFYKSLIIQVSGMKGNGKLSI